MSTKSRTYKENNSESERIRIITPYSVGLLKYSELFGLSSDEIDKISISQIKKHNEQAKFQKHRV